MSVKWKKADRMRRSLTIIWLIVLALTLFVVTTMPLAMSKYAAIAMGSAEARIAKWDVKYPPHQIALWNNGTALPTYTGKKQANGDDYSVGGSVHQNFALENNSEVFADFYCWVGYVDVNSTDAVPTESSPKSPYVVMSLVNDKDVPQFYDQSNIGYYNSRIINSASCTIEKIAGEDVWKVRVPMKEVAMVRVSFNMGSFSNNLGHRCKVFAQAVQVD